jgi:hypothetical protein
MTISKTTISGTLRLSLLTTALLTAFTFSAAAETNIYKDVAQPNGHPRSLAAKHADIRACGGARGVSDAEYWRVDACMRAHGWAIDHVIPDPPRQEPREDPDHNVVHFEDMRTKPNGAWRGDAAVQADTRRCSPHKSLDYESQEFKQCMLGRGWQFTYTKYATTPRGREQTWKETDDDGTLLTCHGFAGGFGAICTNF